MQQNKTTLSFVMQVWSKHGKKLPQTTKMEMNFEYSQWTDDQFWELWYWISYGVIQPWDIIWGPNNLKTV